MVSLPGLLVRAGSGELPSWAEVSSERREHMARVSALLSEWAATAGLPADDRARWAAAGHLHDALKDADPEVLRRRVPPGLADLPAKVLHGPAVAERLRSGGIDDEELLLAVGFHTIGHPAFGALGRALYVADFLDPGRDFRNAWRDALRARMPSELDAVAREVAGARVTHLVDRRMAIRPETVGFWNALCRKGP